MKKPTKVLVTCIQCPKCNDVIYSRANHDFHFCTCGEVAIDGGFDYIRFLSNYNLTPFKKFIKGETRQSLYQDWNQGIDKYGKISPKNREVKEVRKITKVWGVNKEFIIRNKKLSCLLDYTFVNQMVNLKKPLKVRKDYKIFGKYFTIIQDLVIDYEIKSK